MAGRKLSDLTTTTSLSENDLVYVVDVSAAAGSKSKGIAKSDLAALMGTTAAATQPVETEYADITALLADQGNQTTGFLQYVLDASADPNIASGEAYYEKLATSTATLADDYRLLSDTEVTVITDSNSYRVFRIQDIQDEGTPLTSVGGGRISFEYNGANVTAILFNKLYTDVIEEFYGKDVNVRFYNRTTRKYQTEAVASTAWTTVNTDYYRAEVTGTNIQIADLSANNRVEFFIVEAAAGGGSTFEYQTEITTNTTLDGTQKGEWKVYPVNSTTAKTITITTGDYVENDVINLERQGTGTVEIIADTGVRIRGVRDIDNRYFINDTYSMVSVICRGSEEFSVIGNLKRGYTGAVTTTSYTSLAPSETADVTVTGTGFSSNMLDPVITGNATLNSWVYVSNTEITLNITSSGLDSDTLDIEYDNGNIFLDVDAITLTSVEYLDSNYSFTSGFGLFQMSESITYFATVRRSSDDAETNVGFVSGKLTLNSPVSAGGDLTTWAGSDSVYVKVLFDQGSFGSDLTQTTNASQPRLLNAGALHEFDSKPFLYFDGVDDYLEAGSGNSWGNGVSNTYAMINRTEGTTDDFLVNDRPDSGFHSFYIYGVNKAMLNGGNVSLVSTASDATVYQKFITRVIGGTSTLYVDGTSVDTDTGVTSVTYNNPIRIGRFGASTYYDGYVNHFVIWKSNEDANKSAIETLINSFV